MRRNAVSLFWLGVGSLLILGLVACTGALLLKPDPAGWIGRLTGIGIWAFAFAVCAGLLTLPSYLRPELLQALAAMWRPLVLLLAAAFLLFRNDQGRELGISLMAENNEWRLFFLSLALIYWATNNWHTARLGLQAAVQRRGTPVRNDEWWLFWPPRLLGVGAHLIAAINLSLAAANQPEFAASTLWPLRFAPVAAIGLATALAWTSIIFYCRSERPANGPGPCGSAGSALWSS